MPISDASYAASDDTFATLLLFARAPGTVNQQLYAWSRESNALTWVSERDVGGLPDAEVVGASITGDGRYASFVTRASNVIGEGNGNFRRSYVRDLWTGELAVVNGDGYGVPRADVSAGLSREGDRMVAASAWPHFSRQYVETTTSRWLVGNPLRCDPQLWGNGFEP